jgi:hypothetical protein
MKMNARAGVKGNLIWTFGAIAPESEERNSQRGSGRFFFYPTSGGGGLIEGRTIMNGSERVAFPVQIIAADYTWFLPEITVVAGAAWLR